MEKIYGRAKIVDGAITFTRIYQLEADLRKECEARSRANKEPSITQVNHDPAEIVDFVRSYIKNVQVTPVADEQFLNIVSYDLYTLYQKPAQWKKAYVTKRRGFKKIQVEDGWYIQAWECFWKVQKEEILSTNVKVTADENYNPVVIKG